MSSQLLDYSEDLSGDLQVMELTDLANGQGSLACNNFKHLKEHEIISTSGIPFRVYVATGKKPAIITFHDIGTNHTSFSGFFNFPLMQVLMENFTVYHICAPGHHEYATPLSIENRDEGNRLLSSGTRLDSTDGKSNTGVFTILGQSTTAAVKQNFVYPSLDELSNLVLETADHFKLSYFVAIGVGAGSNVLARAALKQSDKILGLFLINPTATTQGYFSWFKNRWSDLPALQRGELTDGLLKQLEQHWFGASQIENLDLIVMYEQYLRSLNSFNVAGYISAFNERTDLGIVRNYDTSKREYVNTIKVPCTLVSGAQSTDLCRTMTDMNGRMDPTRTEFVSVEDCTGMLMEESPEKLCSIFLLFLRSCGLVINMTMEKLKALAKTQYEQRSSVAMTSETLEGAIGSVEDVNQSKLRNSNALGFEPLNVC